MRIISSIAPQKPCAARRGQTIKNKKRAVFGVIFLAVFAVVLISSDIAIEYMKKGLSLCARVVIPSLFPFAVISELLVASGIGFSLSAPLARPMKKIFGISEAGACVFLLGTLCGFPIGARSAALMYDRGDISAREFTRLMTFCNNPGSAFVISAVGVSLLGNGQLGVLIYVCVILSALVVGFVGQFFFRDGEENQSTSRALAPSANEMAVEIFTRAVSSSASSMLTVCAYVTFFSTLVGCVGHFLSMAGVSATLTAFVSGALEISGGVGAMSALPEPMLAAVGCAAVVGWSGISVHCQIMSMCAGRGVSFKPYFIAKAAQSIICAAMVAAVLLLSRLNGNTGFEDVFLLRSDGDFCGSIWVCIGFFALSAAPIIIKICRGEKHLVKKSKKIKKSS